MKVIDPQKEIEDLYRLYAPKLRKAVGRRIANSQLCEDVVQDTFVRALLNLDKLDRTRQAWPWLFAIAVNTSKNALRDQSRRAVPIGDDMEMAKAVTGYLPDPEQHHLALDTLRALNPRYRRVLIYREMGWSDPEIARFEGITVNLLWTVFSRARSALRKQIRDQGERLRSIFLQPLAALIARLRELGERARASLSELSLALGDAFSTGALPTWIRIPAATGILATVALLATGLFGARPPVAENHSGQAQAEPKQTQAEPVPSSSAPVPPTSAPTPKASEPSVRQVAVSVSPSQVAPSDVAPSSSELSPSVDLSQTSASASAGVANNQDSRVITQKISSKLPEEANEISPTDETWATVYCNTETRKTICETIDAIP